MMTDRQRVEALFFPLLFKSIIKSSSETTDGNAKAVEYLDEGMQEVLRIADDRKRAAIWRRVLRVHDAVLDPDRKGGIKLEKAGLIGFYLLQAVLSAGYLELEEGSRVAVAIGAVIEALGAAFLESRLDASAKKQARKMLEQLRGQGYFDGVTFEMEAA
jgi:hypothetical protein